MQKSLMRILMMRMEMIMNNRKKVMQNINSRVGKDGQHCWSYFGLASGTPWCAAEVYYTLIKCGFKSKFKPSNPFYVPVVQEWLEKNAKTVYFHGKNNSLKNVKMGDIVIFSWSPWSRDHIGFARAGATATQLRTTEGNTSGGVVAKKKRPKKYIHSVYRLELDDEPKQENVGLDSPELYYHSDQKKSQCVIASMVNAMRRRQVLHNGEWKDITITNAKKQGARQGNYECEFYGTKFKIHYDLWTSKGTTEEKKKADLIARLKEHPAGVCIHGAHTSFAKSKKNPTAHGVLITEYKDGTFYGVNPSHNGKRYGYSKTSGKGIETIKAMNMTDKLMKYTRISYLEVIK